MSRATNIWRAIAIVLMLSVVFTVGGIIVSNQLGRDTTVASVAVPPDTSWVTNSLRDLDHAYVEIAKHTRPAVVMVSTDRVLNVSSNPFGGDQFFNFFFNPGQQQQAPQKQQFHQRGLGSGIIVSSDGKILTNNHVVDGADSIYVRTYDGVRYTAKVLGVDPKTDIAVIQIPAKNLPVMPIGNSDSLQVGEIVLAVGSPMSENLAHTVTQGIVSAKGRSNFGLADYEDFIQTDAAINPGNSGGPLVNIRGQLIGINTAILSQSGGFQGIGFAVPVNMAMDVMHSLITNGRVIRGWLGVSIQDVNDAMASAMDLEKPGGALVSDVADKGPAHDAGLQPGDVILAVNDQAIHSASELRSVVASSAPGTKVALKIERSGHMKTVDVTLGELPAKPELAMKGGNSSSASELLGFRVSNARNDLSRQYGTDVGESGVFVVSIDPNSAAYQAGVREGDLIHGVNRHPIKSVADFNQIVGNLKKGDSVLLHIQRSNAMYFVAFQL